jgi:hypothetical protein
MRIRIIKNTRRPESKLAEAEIWFEKGTLDGLKLRGISIWKSKIDGKEPFVDFPDRRYKDKDGEDQKYVYLVPIDQGNPQANTALRTAVLEAYYQHIEADQV